MSAMRKIGEYLGLLEDNGRYDDEYDESYDDAYGSAHRPVDDRTEEHAVAVPAGRSRLREARGTVSDLSERRRPAVASNIEL